MKANLKNPTLSLILFCIVFNSIAQSANHNFVFKSNRETSIPKVKLPQNNVAFLFTNTHVNTSYSNPALAMLNINNKAHQQKIENSIVTVNSLISNETVSLEQDDICIFANTTDDELWVQVKNISLHKNNFNIDIYNAIGEIEYTSCIESNLHKINLCNLSAGVYLIKLGDNVQKMIIE